MSSRSFVGFIKKLVKQDAEGYDAYAETVNVPADRSPFYFRIAVIMLGLYLFFTILDILQPVLVPLCYATLIGILLNPLVNRLMQWRIPKIVAIIIAILLAILVLGGVIFFIASQFSRFGEMAPQFKQKAELFSHQVQSWLNSHFNLSYPKQKEMIQGIMKKGQENIGGAVGNIVTTIGVIILLPIYTFLMLYYKPLFLNFFYDVVDDRHEKRVADVLNETKGVIQAYVSGLMIEMGIIAALNTAALLIIGVKYAVVLALVGAILNVIPYIGGLIAIAMPVLVAYVTGDGSWTKPLIIVISYTVIQFMDNNFIVPRIVSSKVSVNAFVTIIIVLLGGSIWGVSGMFLAVPFIAVCKIIFDRIPSLKPWGRVLGAKMYYPLPPKEVVNPEDAVAMAEERLSILNPENFDRDQPSELKKEHQAPEE